jgi:hypothetical protein
VPKESERLERRRQYLQNKVSAKEPAERCEDDGVREERLAALPVVAE